MDGIAQVEKIANLMYDYFKNLGYKIKYAQQYDYHLIHHKSMTNINLDDFLNNQNISHYRFYDITKKDFSPFSFTEISVIANDPIEKIQNNIYLDFFIDTYKKHPELTPKLMNNFLSDNLVKELPEYFNHKETIDLLPHLINIRNYEHIIDFFETIKQKYSFTNFMDIIHIHLDQYESDISNPKNFPLFRDFIINSIKENFLNCDSNKELNYLADNYESFSNYFNPKTHIYFRSSNNKDVSNTHTNITIETTNCFKHYNIDYVSQAEMLTLLNNHISNFLFLTNEENAKEHYYYSIYFTINNENKPKLQKSLDEFLIHIKNNSDSNQTVKEFFDVNFNKSFIESFLINEKIDTKPSVREKKKKI